MSPAVQNQSISGPTKRTDVFQIFFLSKTFPVCVVGIFDPQVYLVLKVRTNIFGRNNFGNNLAQCELALIFPQSIRCKMPTESYTDISVAEINAFSLWRITAACLGNNEMNICKGYVTGLRWEMIFFII